MSSWLKAFHENIPDVVKSENILDTANNVFKNVNDDIIPTLEKVIDESSDDIKDSKLLNIIAKFGNFKAKDGAEMLSLILGMFKDIKHSERDVVKYINDNFKDVITDKTVTTNEMTIMKIINDIAAMSQYTMDLVYVSMLKDSETDIPKFRIEQINAGIGAYYNLLDTYLVDFQKVLKKATEVKEVVVDDKKLENESMLSKFLGSNFVDLPMASNFNNNPIYHIRMWLVDNDMDNYDLLTEKRKLIELKVAELKAVRESGDSSSKMKKRIEYYENKLNDIEYKIKELETV